MREEYGIFVTVEIPYKVWNQYNAVVMTKIPALNGAGVLLGGFTTYDNPEQALLEGIKETCKYLLDEKDEK